MPTVTIRIDEDTCGSFAKRAKAENRSLANFIETAVKNHIRESMSTPSSAWNRSIVFMTVADHRSRSY